VTGWVRRIAEPLPAHLATDAQRTTSHALRTQALPRKRPGAPNAPGEQQTPASHLHYRKQPPPTGRAGPATTRAGHPRLSTGQPSEVRGPTSPAR